MVTQQQQSTWKEQEVSPVVITEGDINSVLLRVRDQYYADSARILRKMSKRFDADAIPKCYQDLAKATWENGRKVNELMLQGSEEVLVSGQVDVVAE